MIKKLEKLGLVVEYVNDVYICRTKRDNLLVIYYNYDVMFGEYLWHMITYNCNTTNCFESEDKLIECLNNYLKN